jgi:CRISPR-associated protein Csb2
MMMRWLCIAVHLLDGRYHGRSDDGRTAQWPPNPHRLFQALVAAAHLGFRRTEWSDAKADAFRWLEQREAPDIIAPPARVGNVVRLYVPNNDLDKVYGAWAAGREPEKLPSALRTGKDLRPHLVQEDGAVHFLWPVAENEWETARTHAELLCQEARHLHCLGLGIDLVAGNGRILSDAERQILPGDVFIARSGDAGWRVPTQGSFDELVARHGAMQTQRVRVGGGRGAARWVESPAAPRVMREVGYRRRAAGARRIVHAFALVDAEGALRSFDPRHAIKVAGQLRHAAYEIARGMKLDPDFVEAFVCGHGEGEQAKNHRFSYLPLPTLPFKGRDGRIRRVLVAEPFGGGGARAGSVARRLASASLVDEETGEVVDLRRLSEDQRDNDGVCRRYLGEARHWGSVTPVVLPGRDDHRTRKAHALVLKALAQAGYTTPVATIELQREPVFPGAEMARAYRPPAYLKPYPRTHAIITFAEPVTGPVVLGAGRHVGLGVFAALAEKMLGPGA